MDCIFKVTELVKKVGFVILVDGRRPICLVCLANCRLSSGKTQRPAGRSGAFFARQRTQAYRRMARTITPRKACRCAPRACAPLSTDATFSEYNIIISSLYYKVVVYSPSSKACATL